LNECALGHVSLEVRRALARVTFAALLALCALSAALPAHAQTPAPSAPVADEAKAGADTPPSPAADTWGSGTPSTAAPPADAPAPASLPEQDKACPCE